MPKNNKDNQKKIFMVVMVVTFLVISLAGSYFTKPPEDNLEKGSISYYVLMEDVKNHKIESIVIDSDGLLNKVVYKKGVGLEERKDDKGQPIKPEMEDGKRIETVFNPGYDDFYKELAAQNVDILYKKPATSPRMLSFLLNLPGLILVLVLIFYFTRLMKNGGFGGVPTPPAVESKQSATDVTFEEVAGMTEEKEELMFAINSMKNIEKYTSKGVKPVKGILLEGPPGVGKTMLVKAVATELGLPVFSYSGSDFVEMFVGVGASRVRKMYKQAEEKKPCIIFLDEVDALGKKRAVNGHSGDREADQTLIALLERMDGMATSSGIMFIAATNRADSLDPALTRPGRFDKIIHIGPPKTKEDREAIVQVHAKNKTFAEGLTIEKIAKQCYGLTGAEIAAVLNDAVLESFKAEKDGVVDLGDIDKAVMKLWAKGLAKGRHTVKDMERVAIHEAGHALMNEHVGRDIIKVSIQPYSSGIGGVTTIDGESKGVSGLITTTDLINDIKVLYSGKVAEEIMLGDGSIGASNDLERATFLIRDYVGAYGMKKGSLLSLVGLGKENMLISSNDALLLKMEEEAQLIYQEVVEFFEDPKVKERLTKVADKLVKDETIFSLQIDEDINEKKVTTEEGVV